MQYRLLRVLALSLVALFLGLQANISAQGITRAAMSGYVNDANGRALEGATVIAVHEPTGARYGVLTRESGQFNLPNVRVGGPYTLTVSYVGFEQAREEGIYLNLGQQQVIDFTLEEENVQTDEVLITSEVSALGGEKTGAETLISEAQLEQLPTIARDLTDFTRLTPQATLTEDGDGELGFSVAGQNNRFNSFFIDGAISNDAFGLTDQGTNGGQAGISPISIDAIEQFNIVVAPYDVTIGGFAGAGINAVTRSGSNDIDASVYWLHRNENLSGKTPVLDPNNEVENTGLFSFLGEEEGDQRELSRLPDFSTNIVGFRVGAPVIKDKLFVFFNAEVERRNQPQPFDFADYIGNSTQADIDNLRNTLNERYGYDAGDYLDNPRVVEGEKFLVRFDYNIDDANTLTLRHSYASGRAEKRNPSDRDDINFGNQYEFFPTTTNSTAAELNTLFGNNAANRLILGFTSVRDDRDPLGDPFPSVSIDDGAGEINFGSEPFSTANNLQQNIFTLTNNFNLYLDRHTLTFGTHNEFYDVFNLFVRQNFGVYEFDNLDDFLNGGAPSFYTRGYSLQDTNANGNVDALVGDEIENAAASFNAMQLGFYVQDDYKPVDNLTLSFGLRLDIPTYLTDPPVAEGFNEEGVQTLEEAGWDLRGARAGQLPSTQFMLSPRFGFSYQVAQTRLRGGVGLFTSRMPLVWAGGSFTNSGVLTGGVFEFDPELANGEPIEFRADPEDQYTLADFQGGADPIPQGQLDLFAEDLKFQQVFRASLAVDQALEDDFTISGEVIFTKNLNSLIYQNVNIAPEPQGVLPGPDFRPRFSRDELLPEYGRIILGYNDREGNFMGIPTSRGYSVNFTASLNKRFNENFSAFVAYNFGDAYSVNDLTSSQNSSQWRNMEVVGSKNFLPVSRSDFSIGHRVVGSFTARYELNDNLAFTLTPFFNLQSGEVYSYTYGGGRADRLTNQDSRDFTDLIYVPRSLDEINLVSFEDADGRLVLPQEQWAFLDAYIEADPYLSGRRGQFAERNAARTPTTFIVDTRGAIDFSFESGGKTHILQLTIDIFNFTNMLYGEWGRRFRSNFNGLELIQVQDVSSDGVPEFTFDPSSVTLNNGSVSRRARLNIDDRGTLSSRWQGQVGVRYIFE